METARDRLHRLRNVIHGVRARERQDLHLFISDAEFLLSFARRIEEVYQLRAVVDENLNYSVMLHEIQRAFDEDRMITKDKEVTFAGKKYYLFPREVVGVLLDNINRLERDLQKGKEICQSLADRCAGQSEALTQRAEKNLPCQSQNLSQEIKRLKEGKFTPEELQNLCHNLSTQDRMAFEKGCQEHQDKLFGREMLQITYQHGKLSLSCPGWPDSC